MLETMPSKAEVTRPLPLAKPVTPAYASVRLSAGLLDLLNLVEKPEKSMGKALILR